MLTLLAAIVKAGIYPTSAKMPGQDEGSYVIIFSITPPIKSTPWQGFDQWLITT
jgi:hypothetical protein